MIEAYCKYDKEMDLLVKDVVKYTLNKYGKQLNISTLKEVEVRNVQEFECPIAITTINMILFRESSKHRNLPTCPTTRASPEIPSFSLIFRLFDSEKPYLSVSIAFATKVTSPRSKALSPNNHLPAFSEQANFSFT